MSFGRILVTGGAGFIGSSFIKLALREMPETQIVNLDKLTYAGRLENLKEAGKDKRYKFIKGDICDAKTVAKAMKECDAVINFAAESHVDRSIKDPSGFIKTDVFGAFTLLEEARKQSVKSFVQISTDEVYGQVFEGSSKETDALMPRNPYSASKAGADRLAYSYFATYGLPVKITRASNNYGPNHFPEKLIPLFITNLLLGRKVPVYGDGLQVRDWLYVEDHCNAIKLVAEKGKNGEVYNVGASNEKTNLWITRFLLNELEKSEEMIEHVADRLGHDRRYSIDWAKIKEELEWQPEISLEEGLKKTVKWYVDNQWWWTPLLKHQL